MDDQQTVMIRDVYAGFGYAYFQSECLHRELCTAFVILELRSSGPVPRPRIDELFGRVFSWTLGEVVEKLQDVLPQSLATELREAVSRRNLLAHQFWYDRAHLMFSIEGLSQLLRELDGHSEYFDRLDSLVTDWAGPKYREIGVTDENLQACLSRVIAGEPGDPPPNRDAIQELKKLLKQDQRLMRVWEFTRSDGRKPLIFELADGSLWQLCDVGLCRTPFRSVEPDWTENTAVKPHLPARIRLRPSTQQPWDYEFSLSNSAVLWVKPGRHPASFRWGVRTPSKSDEGVVLDENTLPK